VSGCQIARLPDCQPFPQDSSVSFQSSVSSPQLAPAGPRLPSLVGARPVTGASAWAPPSLLCSELSEGERGAAIGLQLVNASSFSCLAPHRHALYQTGTVSGDLYRNAGTSNTAASHSLEYGTSMPMLKIYCHRSGSTTKTRPPAFSAEAKRLDVDARLCTRGAVNGRTDVAVSTGGASLEP